MGGPYSQCQCRDPMGSNDKVGNFLHSLGQVVVVLEAIIGRTLEQSLVEVLEEEVLCSCPYSFFFS